MIPLLWGGRVLRIPVWTLGTAHSGSLDAEATLEDSNVNVP